MAQLIELKIRFETGDLTQCSLDYKEYCDCWTLYFLSKSENKELTLDKQRKDENLDNTRRFKTADAALKVAGEIGFDNKRVLLTVPGALKRCEFK